jgi:hypothetical protein
MAIRAIWSYIPPMFLTDEVSGTKGGSIRRRNVPLAAWTHSVDEYPIVPLGSVPLHGDRGKGHEAGSWHARDRQLCAVSP